jgi:hypothetical protein
LIKWVDETLSRHYKKLVDECQMDGLFDWERRYDSLNYYQRPSVTPEIMFICEQYYLLPMFKVKNKNGKISDIRDILAQKINQGS